MKFRAIHQFHSGSASGDAVTNGMFLTQRLLRELGFDSDIHVEHIAPELAADLRSYRDYRPSPDQVLIVRHSHGHNVEDWVHGLPDRKFLLYHNITPYYFFPPECIHRKYSQIGRQQLRRYRPLMPAAIADSEYNAQELRALGFPRVSVVPLLVDVPALQSAPWNEDLVRAAPDIFTVLFVGRVAPNKCQHHLIAVFRHLVKLLKRPARLVLVGGYSEGDPYYASLRQWVDALGLSDNVIFTGKVSNADLYAWYRTADVYVSLSEHEGFGVPLIEAMAFDVPVVAYRSTTIPYTLDGSGLLVSRKDFAQVAATVSVLANDRALRREILLGQRRRLHDFSPQRLREGLADFLCREGLELPRSGPAGRPLPARQPTVQIEGPFESSYSLAIVNRELGFAFEKQTPGSVALFATEGPGDYPADQRQIRAHPGLEELWKRSRKCYPADIVIRNLYPPRVHDMKGLVNLLYFAWEESGLAQEWVRSFNRHLDGFTVLSSYVKKVLLDAGVHVPIRVGSCGIEQITRVPARPLSVALGKRFRFLHISSCFPRKGVDILLRAYARAFSVGDDVSLVIKTFPNIHNTVAEQIEQLRAGNPDCPDIVLINCDVEPDGLRFLYENCHALVAPTRGEGFGLPMAEAMLFNLPVITTAFGGQRDFCTPETAWLVDFQWVPAQTHMGLHNSVWMEPDAEHLARLMREVHDSAPEAIRVRTRRARQRILEHFTWERSAVRVHEAARDVRAARPCADRKLKLGWVSSWNARCGISGYSAAYVENLPAGEFEVTILAGRLPPPLPEDEPNVIRCWDNLHIPHVRDLARELRCADYEVVVINFNFGFFDLDALGELIEQLHSRSVAVVVIFHATADIRRPDLHLTLARIKDRLRLPDRLIVHGVDDLNRLKEYGLVSNVSLFPHGVVRCPVRDPLELRRRLGLSGGPILGSYGFLLPHKGIPELIQAFPQVLARHPDARLLLVNALYPLQESVVTRDECRGWIDRLGIGHRVVLMNDFLPDREALTLLECADLIVFPYQGTGESSSAAVRGGLSSNRPVACTPLPIFNNVRDICHLLPGTTPDRLGEGILALLADPVRLASRHEAQQKWLCAHSWEVLGERLGGLLRGLVGERLRGSGEEPASTLFRVA
jgi:glycosyltransferase involved in cell wall biosynthesis